MAQSLDNLSRTWSDSGTTFTAIKYDITDSASAAGSLLMDLQVGGASKFQVAKNGNPRIDGNGYDWVLDANAIPNTLAFSANGVASWVGMVDAGLKLGGNIQFGVTLGATTDLILARDAANTLAQRNGANAQTFRLYNTTDAGITNFERAKFAWSSNVLQIGTEKGGTGTARALEFQTDGTTRLTIAATGTININGASLVGAGGKSRIADTGTITVVAGQQYTFGPTTSDLNGADTGIAREAANKLVITNGSTGAGSLVFRDAGNIEAGTTTGTKIGTATTQKLGFYNATPVVQPTAVADATDGTDVVAQLNALLSRMRTLGLIAT